MVETSLKALIRLFIVGLVLLIALPADAQSTKAPQAESKVIRACHATWGKLGGVQLPHQGIHAHFIEAVFHRAGYKVETTITNWARCVDHVEKMAFDFTMAWESAKFRKIFEFFSFALKTPLNFVVLRESPLIDGSIDAMVGKSIGYLRNTGGLENYYARESEFKSPATGKVKVLFPMLLKGRIDALIMDPASLWDEVNSNHTYLKGRLRTLQPPIQVNIASPTISRKHPRLAEFREAYEKAYAELVDDAFIKFLEKTHDMTVIR